MNPALKEGMTGFSVTIESWVCIDKRKFLWTSSIGQLHASVANARYAGYYTTYVGRSKTGSFLVRKHKTPIMVCEVSCV
jgi:hypothetical protein